MRACVVLFLIIALSVACENRHEAKNVKIAAYASKGVTPKNPPPLSRPEIAADADPKKTSFKSSTRDLKVIEKLSTAKIIGIRPISMRSLSLKVTLKGNAKAVFKPIRKNDSTARFEVAFYRLAKMLNVGIVPVSTMRLVPRAKIMGHLNVNFAEAAKSFDIAAKDSRSGAVEGAMIEWISDIKPTPFDVEGGRRKLTKLLAIDGPSATEEPLAPMLSSAIVLDYIAGNWDRFSGGNLFFDASGDNLVLIDNNGAFSRWSKRQQNKMDKLLFAVERYCAKLISQVRGLNYSKIEGGLFLKSDKRGKLILDKDEILRIIKRKDDLITRIDSLIAVHGKDKILVFP